MDEITNGGLPKGRPTLICGGAGCGKTLLAMEFLVRGATVYNEPGVFISFEETEQDVLTLNHSEVEKVSSLVVYNDDVNSFDFVIECFIKICKHNELQAEQCTNLVHYKGKCAVKSGTYNDLEGICTALLDRGLTAKIE